MKKVETADGPYEQPVINAGWSLNSCNLLSLLRSMARKGRQRTIQFDFTAFVLLKGKNFHDDQPKET